MYNIVLLQNHDARVYVNSLASWQLLADIRHFPVTTQEFMPILLRRGNFLQISVTTVYSSRKDYYPDGVVPTDEDHCQNGVKAASCVLKGKVETSGDGSIRILFPAGQFQALMQRVICLAASISDLPCQDVGVLSGGPLYRNG